MVMLVAPVAASAAWVNVSTVYAHRDTPPARHSGYGVLNVDSVAVALAVGALEGAIATAVGAVAGLVGAADEGWPVDRDAGGRAVGGHPLVVGGV